MAISCLNRVNQKHFATANSRDHSNYFHYHEYSNHRTAEEFRSIVNNCPFSEQDLADARATATGGESLHVALLSTVPIEENGAKLLQYVSEKERCIIKGGRDVYLLFYDSIRNAKLSQQLPKLEVPATVRNWKTMMKLATMIDE